MIFKKTFQNLIWKERTPTSQLYDEKSYEEFRLFGICLYRREVEVVHEGEYELSEYDMAYPETVEVMGFQNRHEEDEYEDEDTD